MKFLFKAKDGGAESLVTGYWLVESKRWGSIVLLRFDEGSREAYHTHAFNCFSWVLWGWLLEHTRVGQYLIRPKVYRPSLLPFTTRRDTFHRVFGMSPCTWVLSFRGPWVDRWKEHLPATKQDITLTHGRRVVSD